MSNATNTVYTRKDLIKQAKKDIKPGLSFHPITYVVFLLFALCVDYKSIAPFQDLVLRTNQTIASALSISIVFCIDVLIPISLTKLIKVHFNQKKLNMILTVSILFSIGIPFVIMVIQKMLGTNITMPDRGTTAVVSKEVKVVTQLLFSFVPLATTVVLTVMGLLRENLKIFRKFRYLKLAKSKATAEKDHITEALKNDESTLKERDDSKFISAITELVAMRDSLFTKSREILAMNIGSPSATEHIINSKPVYRASEHLDFIKNYIKCNPAVHVCFEGSREKEKNGEFSTKPHVSMFEMKEEEYNEKESA